MPEINVNALIEKAKAHPKVKQSLAAKRDQIKTRAEQIAATDKVPGEFTTEDGTRPKGRPYARLYFSNVDQEFGTSKTKRWRVLGRAAQ